MTHSILPTFFISHGGGPWPWMPEEKSAYAKLTAALQAIPGQVGMTPIAVLMISAHWEESIFTVMNNANPPMIYDYHGFPEHTYQIQYRAPGAPQIATRVRHLLEESGIDSKLDPERGYDHGLYSSMFCIYPNADVPVLQMSLKRGLDPQEHLAVGRALAPLRREGVLIIGSGLSYHNLRAFGPQASGPSTEFDDWLQHVLVKSTAEGRDIALIDWENAPSARLAHPREEHLLPLMVTAGAAGTDAATCVYHENAFLGGVSVSNFMFGDG